MTEKRAGDADDWCLADGDTAIVYMCGIDWMHHTLADADGTKFYSSEADLRAARECVDQCGIVEVEVKVRRWVQPPRIGD